MTADLAKLKEAAEAATPGPWLVTENEGWDEAYCDWHSVGPLSLPGGELTPDTRFIALAREGVQELFARLEAAEAAHASALARVAVLEGALREARENILSFVHARWSEAEGSDEDHVGYIDAALRTEGEGQAAKEQGKSDE